MHPQIVAVARTQHDAMLAERHRVRIAIFGLVMDREQGHRRSNHRDSLQSNLYRSLLIRWATVEEKWSWTAPATHHYSSAAKMFRRCLKIMRQAARRSFLPAIIMYARSRYC